MTCSYTCRSRIAARLAWILMLLASPRTVAGQSVTGPEPNVEDRKRLEELASQFLPLHRAGKDAEALPIVERFVELHVQCYGAEHWKTTDARQWQQRISVRSRLSDQDRAALARADQELERARRLLGREQLGACAELVEGVLRTRQQLLGPEALDSIQCKANLALVVSHLGQHEKARQLYTESAKSLERAMGTHPKVATAYSNLGLHLQELDELPEAEDWQAKALKISLATVGPDNELTARIRNNLAVLLDRQGKFEQAREHHLAALNCFLQTAGERSVPVIRCRNNLAANARSRGQLTEAEQQFRVVLDAVREVLPGRNLEWSDTAMSLAEVLDQVGKYQEAEALLRQAWGHFTTELGKQHPRTVECLHSLAANLADQGRWDEAEPLYRQAIAQFISQFGERSSRTARAYSNLASLLDTQGQDMEAERLYRKSIEIWESLPGNALSLSTSCNNLGLLLANRGSWEQAEHFLQRAHRLKLELFDASHPAIAQSLNNLGGLAELSRDDHRAEGYYRQALELYEKADPTSLQVATCYNNLASSIKARDRFHEKEQYLRQALLLRQKRLPPHHPLLGQSYKNLGSYLLRSDQLQQAEVTLREALKVYDVSRLRVGPAGLDRFEFAAERSPLPALAEVLVLQGKPVEAWNALEQHLGRGLLDEFSARQLRPLTDQERQRERLVLGELQRLQERLLRRRVNPSPATNEQEELPALIRREHELLVELDALEETLKGRDTPLASASLQQIQAALPESGALLTWLDTPASGLQPEDPGNRHWACLVTKRGVPNWVRLDGSGINGVWTTEDLTLASELRAALRSNSPRWKPLARRLAVQRLSPIQRHLEGVEQLVVLPSSAMAGIPLEVLQVEQRGNSLGTSSTGMRVSYAPSASLLIRLMAGDEIALGDARLLAVGDPDYLTQATDEAEEAKEPEDGRAKLPWIGGGQKPLRLERIPGSRWEVESVAELFSPDRVTLLVGADANEADLQALATRGDLREYACLHLATHGKANRRSAMLASLYFAPRPARQSSQEQPSDGIVTARQIMDTWDLEAQLVVLSACETGLGVHTPAEGYLGFTQALFAKGAKSVVLSLWQVDDQATSLLMRRFYENLTGQRQDLSHGLPKAQALAEAKAWLRELMAEQARSASLAAGLTRGERSVRIASVPSDARPFAHPYYWAAFVLIGDPT